MKLLILFVAVLACVYGEDTCSKDTCGVRTEKIYSDTKASTVVKEYDIIGGLTNLYTICIKMVHGIWDTFVKYYSQLVHEIERAFVGIAKTIRVEVRK